MRNSISSSFRCAKRPDDLVRWARAFAASPASTLRDLRERQIVSDLLTQLGGTR